MEPLKKEDSKIQVTPNKDENYYWKKAKRFLWELSVVVTGIAITFMVGG